MMRSNTLRPKHKPTLTPSEITVFYLQTSQDPAPKLPKNTTNKIKHLSHYFAPVSVA